MKMNVTLHFIILSDQKRIVQRMLHCLMEIGSDCVEFVLNTWEYRNIPPFYALWEQKMPLNNKLLEESTGTIIYLTISDIRLMIIVFLSLGIEYRTAEILLLLIFCLHRL